MCFVDVSLKEALKQSMNVHIEQHYILQTAAPRQPAEVNKYVFVGSCRGSQMGLFWRYHLTEDRVALYLNIFPDVVC